MWIVCGCVDVWMCGCVDVWVVGWGLGAGGWMGQRAALVCKAWVVRAPTSIEHLLCGHLISHLLSLTRTYSFHVAPCLF